MNWVSFFRDSPLENMEAEILMGNFVTAAARAGQWVDIPVKKDEPIEQKIDLPDGTAMDFSSLMFEFNKSAQILTEKGFIEKIADDDGKEWLRAKKPLANFVKERLKRFAPLGD